MIYVDRQAILSKQVRKYGFIHGNCSHELTEDSAVSRPVIVPELIIQPI
jgi:hypothetical protein